MLVGRKTNKESVSMGVLVCLTAGEEFYSRAIRKLTKSNVNHAFIAYTSKEWGGWWAVQTDERGVVKIPAEKVECQYIECYDMGIPMEMAMSRTRMLYGESYDWEGIGGFLIKLLAWRLFQRKIVNPLHKDGELFCSEYVTTFLQCVDGMYPEIMDLNPSSVAPGGAPEYLGTPSLQWELQKNEKIYLVECPWGDPD